MWIDGLKTTGHSCSSIFILPINVFMHNLIPFVYINLYIVSSLSQEICIISHLLVAQSKCQCCLGTNRQTDRQKT